MSESMNVTENVETSETGPDVKAAVSALSKIRQVDASTDAFGDAIKSAEDPFDDGEPKAAPAKTDKPADEPDPNAHEVQVPEAAALKSKLRANIAAQEKARAELNAERSKLEQERRDFQQRQEQARNEFATRIKESPADFLRELGIDLPTLARIELQKNTPEEGVRKALEEAQAAKKRIEEYEARQKQTEEQSAARQRQLQEQQVVAQQEAQFVQMAKADPAKTPFLAKLSAKNPVIAVQNAYIAQRQYQNENAGQNPSMEELVALVESQLRDAFAGDEAPTAAPGKPSTAKISPKSNAAPVVEKPVDEMTPDEKLRFAARKLRETRQKYATED